MKIAIVAPLVSAIREPQAGGSQAFVADLSRGLASRGHEVHVYAAAGSQIPGVTVIDTGVDHRSLEATLYRANTRATRGQGAAAAAFARVYSILGQSRYDVVHNHAFDAPAIALASSLAAPVVHTLHLPPAGRRGHPPRRGEGTAAARRRRRVCLPVERVEPGRPRRRGPVALCADSRHTLVTCRRQRRALRGQAESREGRRRGDRHRPARGDRDRRVRRQL